MAARHYEGNEAVARACFRWLHWQSAFGMSLLLISTTVIIKTRRARLAHVMIPFFIQKSDLKSSCTRSWAIHTRPYGNNTVADKQSQQICISAFVRLTANILRFFFQNLAQIGKICRKTHLRSFSHEPIRTAKFWA